MSKQPANQETKSTIKQERRRERRDEQLRHAVVQRRAAFIRRIAIGGVIAVVVLSAASYLYFTHGANATNQSSVVTIATPTIVSTLPATSTPTAASTPTSVPINSPLAPGATIDNVQCNATEKLTYHVHAHLSIYIKGQAVPVSQNIGITNNCYYWLHTHDTTGVIHIEAPQQVVYTVGNFLHVWKQQFAQLDYPSQLDQSGGWKAYVNGQPYSGDFNAINLDPHALITLAYQSPGITPDTIFSWGTL